MPDWLILDCFGCEMARQGVHMVDFAFAMQRLGMGAVSLFGTEERRQWLARTCAGTAIAGIALTEPGSGRTWPVPRLRRGRCLAAGRREDLHLERWDRRCICDLRSHRRGTGAGGDRADRVIAPHPLAACRTGFKNLAFCGIFASLGALRVPLALERSRHGALPVVWHGRAGVNCPYPAYPSLNMRLRFHAIVTRLHSPRAFSRPRIENWRNPSTDLMIPKTGSGVCLRSA